MQSLLVLTILLVWCSFIIGEQRILSPVDDELQAQSSVLFQTEVETDDPNLVDVTADRRHHPVHKGNHPHSYPRKNHPYHPHKHTGQHPHPHGKRHHLQDDSDSVLAADDAPIAESSVVPAVAVELALTEESESQAPDSTLVEADRRHHPVHKQHNWHQHGNKNHPHSNTHRTQHPHSGSHPHRPHHPHEVDAAVDPAAAPAPADAPISSASSPAAAEPALTSATEESQNQTPDSTLVEADRRHHPVHTVHKNNWHHGNTKHHPHSNTHRTQHPHSGSHQHRPHHPHEVDAAAAAVDPAAPAAVDPAAPAPAAEPALTSASQSESQTPDSTLVEADRRHHPVHKTHTWHHHTNNKNHPHSNTHRTQHPHSGSHPHRRHHPHESESLLSDASSSAASSVVPPANVPADLLLSAEQSAEELSDLLAERAELAKLADQLSAIELQVVDAQAQQIKLSSKIAAARKALTAQQAAADLLMLEQGYHAVAERDTTRYAAEMETMKLKVKTEADALLKLQEEWKLKEDGLNLLMLQEADIASDHKLQVEITKKANALYCSNVCKSVKLTDCLSATAACDKVPKVKAVDWINVAV